MAGSHFAQGAQDVPQRFPDFDFPVFGFPDFDFPDFDFLDFDFPDFDFLDFGFPDFGFPELSFPEFDFSVNMWFMESGMMREISRKSSSTCSSWGQGGMMRREITR